jgi:hypothetical protein
MNNFSFLFPATSAAAAPAAPAAAQAAPGVQGLGSLFHNLLGMGSAPVAQEPAPLRERQVEPVAHDGSWLSQLISGLFSALGSWFSGQIQEWLSDDLVRDGVNPLGAQPLGPQDPAERIERNLRHAIASSLESAVVDATTSIGAWLATQAAAHREQIEQRILSQLNPLQRAGASMIFRAMGPRAAAQPAPARSAPQAPPAAAAAPQASAAEPAQAHPLATAAQNLWQRAQQGWGLLRHGIAAASERLGR